ncbi:PREDICTED: uncharacterized protein LOC105368155 isoform X2 [Ceratosolen solmsi marchali]|uniref:Uncharacterized protein LOC105368155 isoform X2 n=1 Tax=Ceratosolen solmsi marchali TaxID=326594 RepID=A0AAJ6YW05_9HYME|nr:PREDICTED: uncharacterized protein LOC105368155 isoform X2 [Ceratosolen solmsi marchali]
MKSSNMNESFLKVPCYSGHLLQNTRSRKCSIVREEEDEDTSSGKDDKCNSAFVNALGRRGSRSEGKLSRIFQDRLAQLSGEDLELKSMRNAHEDSSIECSYG